MYHAGTAPCAHAASRLDGMQPEEFIWRSLSCQVSTLVCTTLTGRNVLLLGQLMEGEEALELVRNGISVLEKAVRAAESSASTSGTDNQAADDADAAMEEEARADAEGSTSGRAAVAELKAQLGGALCALAEMVMGSTGDPSSVAADVEALLQRARIADARSPEPLQVLASLRCGTDPLHRFQHPLQRGSANVRRMQSLLHSSLNQDRWSRAQQPAQRAA
jgi:hypothetical protein